MGLEKNIYIRIRENLKEEHRHMAIPQTGAAIIVTNDDGQILLVKKAYGHKWVFPGGVQELGEDLRQAAKRELFEETGINYEPNLILIDILAGEGRHKTYPNGDEVYNNTALFLAPGADEAKIDISGSDYQDEDGKGTYKTAIESSDFGWFGVDDMPEGFDDLDLLNALLAYKKQKLQKVALL